VALAENEALMNAAKPQKTNPLNINNLFLEIFILPPNLKLTTNTKTFKSNLTYHQLTK
jgi:hypothetical protein